METNRPVLLNCPTCGAPLDVQQGNTTVVCKFCGNRSLIPGAGGGTSDGAESTWDEIRQLALNGDEEEAVERCSQLFHISKENAAHAVEALKDGRLASTWQGSTDPQELTRAFQQIRAQLQRGNQLEAIKIYRQAFGADLETAKRVIDQLAANIPPQFNSDTPPPLASTPTGGCRRSAILISILILVLGLAGGFFLWKGGVFTPHYYPLSPSLMIPTGQGQVPQVATGLYDTGQDTRFIGLVDGQNAKLAWKAAALSGDGYISALAFSSDMIFAVNETNLLAYHRSDGSLAWQTVMPDLLNSGENDLIVNGGLVIVSDSDQSIQAYDAETGSPVWNYQMNGYDRSLRLAGNILVLIDRDENFNNLLLLLKASDGAVISKMTLSCGDTSSPQQLQDDTNIVVDPAGSAIYVTYYEGCVQRVDIQSQMIAWSTQLKNSFDQFLDGISSLIDGQSLFLANGDDLVKLNTNDGTSTILLTKADYAMIPLFIVDDRLIVRAKHSRGTGLFELWGVDLANGGLAWQKSMQGAESIDPPDEMVGFVDKSDWGWTIAPKTTQTSSVIYMLTFKGEPDELVIDSINSGDGTVANETTLKLNRIGSDFYSIPAAAGWQDGIGYFVIEDNVYSIDPMAAKVKVLY